MPDIAMCGNKTCPLKDMCYRFTAKPSPYQSYFHGPGPIENGKCNYYIENGVKSVDIGNNTLIQTKNES